MPSRNLDFFVFDGGRYIHLWRFDAGHRNMLGILMVVKKERRATAVRGFSLVVQSVSSDTRRPMQGASHSLH